MMAKKQNPLLAAFEAKLRREFEEEKAAMEDNFKQRLARNSEITMIATLIGGNRLGFLGEKRADVLIDEMIDVKMEIADVLLKDAEVDPQLTYTKADLARSVKQILGNEAWERHKNLFPLLRDYW
jgi:hypothetical protein